MNRKIGFCSCGSGKYQNVCNCLTPQDRRRKFQPLNAKQKKILVLLASDHSTRQIVSCMGVPLKTVEWNRQELMAKLKIRSSVRLTHYALKHRLVKNLFA